MFTNVNTTTVDPVLHFVLLNSPTTTAQHFGTFRTTDCHLLLRLMTTEPHFTLLRSRAYKICQTRFKILPNIKYTLKKLPKTFKILPKWRQIWPNPVTLDAAFVCSFNERPERIVIDLAAKEWKNKTF